MPNKVSRICNYALDLHTHSEYALNNALYLFFLFADRIIEDRPLFKLSLINRSQKMNRIRTICRVQLFRNSNAPIRNIRLMVIIYFQRIMIMVFSQVSLMCTDLESLN